jgi:hypothetical protein
MGARVSKPCAAARRDLSGQICWECIAPSRDLRRWLHESLATHRLQLSLIPDASDRARRRARVSVGRARHRGGARGSTWRAAGEAWPPHLPPRRQLFPRRKARKARQVADFLHAHRSLESWPQRCTKKRAERENEHRRQRAGWERLPPTGQRIGFGNSPAGTISPSPPCRFQLAREPVAFPPKGPGSSRLVVVSAFEARARL